jgi:leader peptidase (prepilin peptidase)/N-methyltransferase
VTYVLVGAVGFLFGLGAHDLALQALDDDTRLRPLNGVCRTCGHNRGWLRWQCQACGTLVAREPVVALLTAGVAAGFLNTIGWNWPLVPYLGFLLLTVALTITDLEAFRIVDRLNLAGTVILALLLTGATAITGDWFDLLRGLGGAAAYFAGSSLLFMAVRGQGFGAGDVKLSVQLGLFSAYLGWSVLGWAVFATAVIGGVVALFLMVTGAANRKSELPYGPPMILGAWTAIVLVGVGAIPIPS